MQNIYIMYFVFESLFVGIYLALLFQIISTITTDSYFYSVLWISGFMKHFFGYYFGLQTLYCRYGDACEKLQRTQKKEHIQGHPVIGSYVKTSLEQLFLNSIIEGFVILGLGYIVSLFVSNHLLTVFLVGVVVHNLAELWGIHCDFCKNDCGFMV